MMTIEFPEGTFEVARNYIECDPCEGCFFESTVGCPHFEDCFDFDREMPGSFQHRADGYYTVFKKIPAADAPVTVWGDGTSEPDV